MIESCSARQNETTGYAEPILSLACPLFSRKVFVVPTLPAASTGTCRNQLSKGSGDLDAAYRRVRELSESLCETLQPEDCVVQTIPEVSPTKWHLAHTSWFFETFVLRPGLPGYRPFDDRFAYIFNSYYHSAGDRHPQPERGFLSRPTVSQVFDYRRYVESGMHRFFSESSQRKMQEFAFVVELGIHHEQQHQELILTDLKHVLSVNPVQPVYRPAEHQPPRAQAPSQWIGFPGGMVDLGHSGEGFAFDNEQPRHRTYLRTFQLADQLVSCAEYLAFIEDGGYQRSELWLSDGWDAVQRGQWKAPL